MVTKTTPHHSSSASHPTPSPAFPRVIKAAPKAKAKSSEPASTLDVSASTNAPTIATNTTTNQRDTLRLIELAILSAVVISNIYFSYSLSAKGALASSQKSSSEANTPTSSTSSASQSKPASVPKMVGGC